jgi:hypothetical protein
MFLVSVEFGEGQRGRLRALAADAAGELNVLGHDGHALLGLKGFGYVVQVLKELKAL